MALGGGRSTPGRGGISNHRRRITYPWFLESSEGGGDDGSRSSRTPRHSSRTPPISSRGRGSYAFCRAIDPDPIPFIDLESDEEEQVVDPGLAWARADYQATEQARHSAEQQQLTETLVTSAVETEQARTTEPARAAQHEEDLQKALNNSVANHEGKGKGKGKDPMEVSDDDAEW